LSIADFRESCQPRRVYIFKRESQSSLPKYNWACFVSSKEDNSQQPL
jgi:hypothetical protein